MIDEHSREDELIVQIIGLKGKIEKFQKEKNKLIEEFQKEFDRFHALLIRIRESHSSQRLRGIIPEIACILEEEINAYKRGGYKRLKWEEKKND